jgi:hypothetical protein
LNLTALEDAAIQYLPTMLFGFSKSAFGLLQPLQGSPHQTFGQAVALL